MSRSAEDESGISNDFLVSLHFFLSSIRPPFSHLLFSLVFGQKRESDSKKHHQQHEEDTWKRFQVREERKWIRAAAGEGQRLFFRLFYPCSVERWGGEGKKEKEQLEGKILKSTATKSLPRVVRSISLSLSPFLSRTENICYVPWCSCGCVYIPIPTPTRPSGLSDCLSMNQLKKFSLLTADSRYTEEWIEWSMQEPSSSWTSTWSSSPALLLSFH